jgi:hypothetical protein
MLLLAYLLFCGGVLWVLTRREHTWLGQRPEWQQQSVRAVAVALACVCVAAGVAGYADAREEGHTLDEDWLGLLIWLVLAAGGAVFAAGTILWRGVLAVRLRRAGWLTIVASLAVPSTLTLLLPVALLPLVALEEIPRRRHRRLPGVPQPGS